MKKIWKIFAAAFFVLFTSVSFSSCDLLSAFLGDMFADAFEGPSDEWLSVKVRYDDGVVAGDVSMAFFYTENTKTGHSTLDPQLKLGYKINKGLTVLCYGKFTPKGTGAAEMVYMKNEIPLEDGAKAIWSTFFNLSPQLRALSEGRDIGLEGNILGGTSYGKWSTYHPEDNEAVGNKELAPSPITNEWFGFYYTNDDQAHVPHAIDWNKPLKEIGLSTTVVTRR